MTTSATTPAPASALNRFAPFSRENPVGYQTREFTLQATREDEQDPRSALRLAISSESGVLRWDWTLRENGGVYEEVLDHGPEGPDLSYVKDGLPFCLDHRITQQIGLGTTPTLDEDRVLRTVVRQGNHPDAEWVFKDMAAGIRQKVSIGYWPGENYVQTKREDGTIVRRYFGWMLYEASSVAVPADYAVGVGRSASGAASASRAGTPADSNMEATMSVDTTSERGAPPAPDTRLAELRALRSTWKDNPAVAAFVNARYADWVDSDVTVDAVRNQIIAELSRAAEQRQPVSAAAPHVTTHNREEDKPWEPAEFFRSVVQASRTPEQIDARLRALRAQNTAVGADGGWAVPDTVATNMLEAARTGGELLKRVTERPVTVGNGYKETVLKEDARTNGARNGGVQHYWVGEDNDLPESQAKTRQVELGLKKIAVVVKLTEEQIEDGPAMQSFIDEQAPEELRFGIERAIWEGTGAGQPMGFTNSGALITVAIEAGQTIANSNTHLWMNAAKMFARMPAGMLSRSAWFINQQLWAKILTATAGAAGAHPMFTPPGQLASLPNGAIYGRPIVPVEYASAEGTVGDFVFAALPDYLLATKGGTRRSISMHVEFLRDRQVLKFVQRVDGQPRTRVPLTPLKGGDTLSPYIALAARS